jgi:hypothetical protein
MTSTYLPRKKSKCGASLILLVAIIGLAFIVTVAAFLVAASNGQDTARLASAKVDIATREDALMRVILQQTSTGVAPGTNTSGVTTAATTWTTIMNNAVVILNSGSGTGTNSTTYVDPTELAALLPLNPALSGVTPANLADTGGTALGIFQGYNPLLPEDPFGGTSGLANVEPTPTPSVLPPLMSWSGGTTSVPLSSTTALTTPQEFFLGSQYLAGVLTASVTQLSASNRWGKITYPNIRFGYKQSGDIFIARRVWWRIPVLYQTAQQTLQDQVGVNRYPSALANYILSIYEIPSQLPISGNQNLQIGLNWDGTAWVSGANGINVAGSIYGGVIQLSPGTYTGGVSSRQQVNVLSTATVGEAGGTPYTTSANSAFDQPGTRETMALNQIPGAAAPVSVAENDGKVLLVPVMPGNQFYMQAPGNPTHWDFYARPYYRCRIRIIITGADPTIIYNSTTGVTNSTGTVGAITVTIYTYADTSSSPDQILGFLDTDAGVTKTTYAQSVSGDLSHNWPTAPTWMTFTSTTTGDRNLLVIDVKNMISALGPGTLAQDAPQLYSIYIGSNPTTEPASLFTASDPAVALTDTNDLSLFTSGLSIVCNQTLYLIDSFNQVNAIGGTNAGIKPPPTSIYAPQVRYGMSGAVAPVALTGQVSIDPASGGTPGPTPVNPFSLVTANNTAIPVSSISAHFNEITDPTLIPPIPRMSLMFTIEKERTN